MIRQSRKTSLHQQELRWAVVGILPALLIFCVVILYPQIMNFRYAFTNFDGFSRSFQFIGLQNFIKIFTNDSVMLKAFWNTLFFSMTSIAIGTVLQLLLAVIIHNGIKGGSALKTVLYLPAVFSMVILSVTWNSILRYSGVLNTFLKTIGASALAVDWLGNPQTAMWSIIFINACTYIGFGVILFMAGLDSISTDVLEAANLDGAGGINKFFYIQLPLIMHSITVMLFIGLTGSLKIFALPFILTRGGPRNATLTLAYNIYNNAFEYNRFGYAAAASITFTVCIGIVTFTQLMITRKREVQY